MTSWQANNEIVSFLSKIDTEKTNSKNPVHALVSRLRRNEGSKLSTLSFTEAELFNLSAAIKIKLSELREAEQRLSNKLSEEAWKRCDGSYE